VPTGDALNPRGFGEPPEYWSNAFHRGSRVVRRFGRWFMVLRIEILERETWRLL
jgi:hypothetical protein